MKILSEENIKNYAIETVSADTSLKNIIHLMIDENLQEVGVIEENDMISVISRDDLLLVLAKLLDDNDNEFKDRFEGLIYRSPLGSVINTLNEIGI